MTILWSARPRCIFTPKTKTKCDAIQLRMAIKAYQSEFSQFPTGTQSEIIRTLSGSNQNHIVFIEIPSDQRNINSEFVDSWKTPFRITYQSGTNVIVTSAGPNKRFDDEDDIKKP